MPGVNGTLVLRCVKQLTNRQFQNWMQKLGSKLSQRDENKAPVCEPRMRNLDSLLADHCVSVKENVEVDDPRPARNQFLASQAALNPLQRLQQRKRLKRSFRFDNAIQKPGLG